MNQTEVLSRIQEEYNILKENKHFQKFIKLFTEDYLLSKSDLIPLASDSRPEIFEEIICISKFKNFIRVLDSASNQENN